MQNIGISVKWSVILQILNSECKSSVSEVDSVPSTCNSTAVLESTTFSRRTVLGYERISRRVRVDQLCPVANSRVS